MNEFDVVIGLEVHVQLKTKSKIFCSCSTEFESPPNTNICPICCGYPGVLPVLNKKALELAIRVAIALNCNINREIYFERKNYFYPDLPKNYQISQYKMPIGFDGFLELLSGKAIKIKRVHLEEDAGKLIHKENYSLVDFNRTGIPLLEIVSEPVISSPYEASEYLNYLKLTLQYIDASDCDMEKGFLRCDANISLKPKDATKLGTKVEIKNMNTFRGVVDALEYEIKRQESLLMNKKEIIQETRLWNKDLSKTISMRTKEEAHDYRYFPEPDLPDFFITDKMLEEQKKFIVEKPQEKRKRFIEQYNLSYKEVDIMISDLWLSNFFEKAISFYNRPKEISNWLLGPFLEKYNSLKDKDKIKISPENFSKIVKYFCEDKLNNLTAKTVLDLCITTNADVDDVILKEGLSQVSLEDELIKFIDEIIKENPKAISEYLNGKKEAIMFLVGCVMKKTNKKANPKVAKELLERRINEKSH